jgi:hypothetical protein
MYFPFAASRVVLWLALIGLLIAPPIAQAQEAPEPASSDTTALPNIAPQEVEIRGQLETRFPRLERQPLVGFNPPPRVPILSSDRRPLIGEYRQDTADLPGSPLRRPDMAPRSFHTGTPLLGQVEALSGRYFDRQARAQVQAPLSPGTQLSSQLVYRGSEGHTPIDALPDAASARDDLEASAGLQFQGDGLSGRVDVGGFAKDYALFGALDRPEASVPGRDAYGGTLGGELSIERNRFALEATAGGSLASLSSDNIGGSAPGSRAAATIDEQRLHADGRLTLPVGRFSVEASGSYDGSDFEMQSSAPRTGWVHRYSGGGAVVWHPRTDVNVRAGALVFGFQDDTAAATVTEVYVAPDVAIDWYPGQNLHLYAYNAPGSTRHDLRHMLDESPFVVNQPTFRPTVRLWNTHAGLRTFLGPVQVGVAGGYEQNPVRRVYQSESVADAMVVQSPTLIRPTYDEARIISGTAELSLGLTTGLQAAAAYTYRDAVLTERNDAPIPYLGTHLATLSLTQSFANQQAFVEVEGTVESDRVATPTATETLDPFMGLNISGSYHVTSALSIVGRADNIIGGRLERWENYPEAPQTISLGLRIRW